MIGADACATVAGAIIHATIRKYEKKHAKYFIISRNFYFPFLYKKGTKGFGPSFAIPIT